jgi:hypothetical protein
MLGPERPGPWHPEHHVSNCRIPTVTLPGATASETSGVDSWAATARRWGQSDARATPATARTSVASRVKIRCRIATPFFDAIWSGEDPFIAASGRGRRRGDAGAEGR